MKTRDDTLTPELRAELLRSLRHAIAQALVELRAHESRENPERESSTQRKDAP